MWAKYPLQMKRIAQRRARLVKALQATGADLSRIPLKPTGPHGPNIVRIKMGRKRKPVFALTYRGLCEIAARVGIKVPR